VGGMGAVCLGPSHKGVGAGGVPVGWGGGGGGGGVTHKQATVPS